jgi:hypothetical protein
MVESQKAKGTGSGDRVGFRNGCNALISERHLILPKQQIVVAHTDSVMNIVGRQPESRLFQQ